MFAISDLFSVLENQVGKWVYEIFELSFEFIILQSRNKSESQLKIANESWSLALLLKTLIFKKLVSAKKFETLRNSSVLRRSKI